MATAWFSLDEVEYIVSGPDRRINDGTGNDVADISIRRMDGQEIPGCCNHPGMIQTHEEDEIPKGLMRRARSALAFEQCRYERMTYKEYHYGKPGSDLARRNARGNF